MANYAVTDFATSVTSGIAAVAEMEVYLDALANTKTIRMITMVPVGNGVQGFIIHDA